MIKQFLWEVCTYLKEKHYTSKMFFYRIKAHRSGFLFLKSWKNNPGKRCTVVKDPLHLRNVFLPYGNIWTPLQAHLAFSISCFLQHDINFAATPTHSPNLQKYFTIHGETLQRQLWALLSNTGKFARRRNVPPNKTPLWKFKKYLNQTPVRKPTLTLDSSGSPTGNGHKGTFRLKRGDNNDRSVLESGARGCSRSEWP